tara:strand:+ start:147 stop:890 length:744 start_codon:yes stop_codon:yes gene_type:complete
MITNEPTNWKDLQNKVDFILRCVGLNSIKEFKLKTPRGIIEVDVFAVDENSLDKIKYIIECKNWNNKIPQNIIHSFTTIMNESGGNIGYIIAKKGFQRGAIEYSKCTNIKLLTYDEFQNEYLEKWFINYFSEEVFNFSRFLLTATYPLNYDKNLRESEQIIVNNLKEKYSDLSSLLLLISGYKRDFHGNNGFSKKNKINIISLGNIKYLFFNLLGIKLNSESFEDLLIELKKIVDSIKIEFKKICNN